MSTIEKLNNVQIFAKKIGIESTITIGFVEIGLIFFVVLLELNANEVCADFCKNLGI